MLVSAPEARSAEGDEGGEAALVSSAADLYQDCHIFLWTVRAYKNTWMMWIYRCFLALKLILYTDYLFMQKYFSDVLLDRKTLQRLY